MREALALAPAQGKIGAGTVEGEEAGRGWKRLEEAGRGCWEMVLSHITFRDIQHIGKLC